MWINSIEQITQYGYRHNGLFRRPIIPGSGFAVWKRREKGAECRRKAKAGSGSNQCRPLWRLTFEGLVIGDCRLLYLMYLPSCQARLIGAGRVMALADRSRLPGAGAATLQQGLSSLSEGRGDAPLLRVPAMLFVPPRPRGDRKPQPPQKSASRFQTKSGPEAAVPHGGTDRREGEFAFLHLDQMLFPRVCPWLLPPGSCCLACTELFFLSTLQTHPGWVCAVGAGFWSWFAKSSLSPAAHLQMRLRNAMGGTHHPWPDTPPGTGGDRRLEDTSGHPARSGVVLPQGDGEATAWLLGRQRSRNPKTSPSRRACAGRCRPLSVGTQKGATTMENSWEFLKIWKLELDLRIQQSHFWVFI